MSNRPLRVLLTGGTRGLGRCMADVLLRQGYQVTICSRSACAEHGRRFKGYRVDLSSRASIDRMLSSWQEGAFDVLINNAGAMFWEAGSSDEGMEPTVALNYLGPVYLTLRLLQQKHSLRVINIGSALMRQEPLPERWWQLTTHYDMAERYALSKALLASFTATLLDRGAAARCVDPGLLRTDLGGGSGVLSTVGRALTSLFGQLPEAVAEAVIEAGLELGNEDCGFRAISRRCTRLPMIVKDRNQRAALFATTRSLLHRSMLPPGESTQC